MRKADDSADFLFDWGRKFSDDADGFRDATKLGHRIDSGPKLTMLGHYNLRNPNYVQLARQHGHNYFDAPGKYATWGANQKFLDRAVNRGDKFVTSGVVHDLKSRLTQELAHLSQRGIWAEVFKPARFGRF